MADQRQDANNLRLVQDENQFVLDFFVILKDRAKAEHSPWDYESEITKWPPLSLVAKLIFG